MSYDPTLMVSEKIPNHWLTSCGHPFKPRDCVGNLKGFSGGTDYANDMQMTPFHHLSNFWSNSADQKITLLKSLY